MAQQLRTAIPVWIVVAVGAVLVGLFAASADYFGWLALVMTAAILLTFGLQLAIVRRGGLVGRVIASLVGSFLILAIATLILGLILLAER